MRKPLTLQPIFSNGSLSIEDNFLDDIQSREEECERAYSDLKRLLEAKQALSNLKSFYENIVEAGVALRQPILFG
jgi:predicted component of type VI protein secretion system